MLRRFAAGRVLGVVALLFGILLMHGLSITSPHGATHHDEHQAALATLGIDDRLLPTEDDGSHGADLLCACACVLLGAAGALLSLGLLSRRRSEEARLDLRAPASTAIRQAIRPPPRRRFLLLSVALR
jgi:hypothetical protein